MHEGITEDGVLHTCRICGAEVYMLDPEEMNEVCDLCSFGGWGATKSAWNLVPGDVIRIGGRTLCVLQNEDFGKLRWLTVRREDGEVVDYVQRSERKVYVHADRQPLA